MGFFSFFIISFVVAHMCVPSNGETEAGEQGQPGLHSKVLSLKTNGKKLSAFELLYEDHHLACLPAWSNSLFSYVLLWSHIAEISTALVLYMVTLAHSIQSS